MRWLTPLRTVLAHRLADQLDITFPQAVGGLVLLEEHTESASHLTAEQLELVLSAAFGLTFVGLPIARETLAGVGMLERHEHGDREDSWEVVAL